MATFLGRVNARLKRARGVFKQGERSRSTAGQAAIPDAGRVYRREQMRAEAEVLRNDPHDVAASRDIAAEMEAIRAW